MLLIHLVPVGPGRDVKKSRQITRILYWGKPSGDQGAPDGPWSNHQQEKSYEQKTMPESGNQTWEKPHDGDEPKWE
jgi:hypothetical protein